MTDTPEPQELAGTVVFTDPDTGKQYKFQRKHPNLAAGRHNPHTEETKQRIARSMEAYWQERRRQKAIERAKSYAPGNAEPE